MPVNQVQRLTTTIVLSEDSSDGKLLCYSRSLRLGWSCWDTLAEPIDWRILIIGVGRFFGLFSFAIFIVTGWVLRLLVARLLCSY
jgi:hypothetical protein